MERLRPVLCSSKSLIKLPLDVAENTGQVYTSCLALGERVGKQNVSSNLQNADELRKELACFQIKMKQCQKLEVLKS